MCNTDSGWVRQSLQIMSASPPYLLSRSAVHSFFCNSGQEWNLHLFSTFTCHICFHSKSGNAPANWASYADFVEYWPSALKFHWIESCCPVRCTWLVRLQRLTSWLTSSLELIRWRPVSHCLPVHPLATYMFLHRVSLYREGARSLGLCPLIHLSCQNLVQIMYFWMLSPNVTKVLLI
jgi:hypothetical protein